MNGDGFKVNPDAIFQLASAYEGAAEWLDGARAAFSSQTGDAPPAVFGLLPAAQDVYRVYRRLAQEAADGLRSVHNTLTSDLLQGLRSSAVSYIETDYDISAMMP
jgi:hypothetical protein